mmetsp:Transcript_37917/g.118858  ORF Transcript_37917/g.118858 Transcript_37917/m.118858 type:complete len:597 (+) Transcript_37917:137-1927(+)
MTQKRKGAPGANGNGEAKCPHEEGQKRLRLPRPDGPEKCTWQPGADPATSPHSHQPPPRSQADCILDSVLGAIGNTPLVRCNSIARDEGIECELLLKCEFFNAGGSVKDRIGKRMVEDAEKQGRIKPGDTLIEPTSGNTGIGLALAAAIKGYRMIITLPEKMSKEKVDVLKALGAEIIRTPTEASFDSPESHIGVARRLQRDLPNAHILDQYGNPSNPLAHYDGTAEEILRQCGGHLDYVVIGTGTGGTLTGIARKLKERLPNVKIIAVDPKGSILAIPDSLNDEMRLQSYKVEGTGYDFIPKVLDREIVDQWIKTDDHESFIMARRLIRQEGLLCGGSSGAAVSAAVKLAKTLPSDKRVVAILPDSVRNYMTKFLSDSWMLENSFVDNQIIRRPTRVSWWSRCRVSELDLQAPLTILPSVKCSDAIDLLSKEGIDMVPVISESAKILGVVTEGNLTALLTCDRLQPNDPVESAVYKSFKKVTLNSTLSELADAFDREPYALVVTEQRCFGGSGAGQEVKRAVVAGVVTRIDLLRFISHHQKMNGKSGDTRMARVSSIDKLIQRSRTGSVSSPESVGLASGEDGIGSAVNKAPLAL